MVSVLINYGNMGNYDNVMYSIRYQHKLREIMIIFHDSDKI